MIRKDSLSKGVGDTYFRVNVSDTLALLGVETIVNFWVSKVLLADEHLLLFLVFLDFLALFSLGDFMGGFLFGLGDLGADAYKSHEKANAQVVRIIVKKAFVSSIICNLPRARGWRCFWLTVCNF